MIFIGCLCYLSKRLSCLEGFQWIEASWSNTLAWLYDRGMAGAAVALLFSLGHSILLMSCIFVHYLFMTGCSQ